MNRDCLPGQTCLLVDGEAGACTLDDDTTCETGVGRACPAGLVCAANRCQAGCASDAECPSDGACLHLPTGEGFCFDARGNADAGIPDGGHDVGVDAYVPPPPVPLGILSACLGPTGGCVVAHDGQVYCWGSGANGRLGTSCTAPDTRTPVHVPGIAGVDDIVCGDGFQCARIPHAGGGFEVHCWGRGGSGQLGRDVVACDPTPQPVLQTAGTPGALVAYGAHLFAAGAHACASDDGRHAIVCWGRNDGLDDAMPTASVSAGSYVPPIENLISSPRIVSVALSPTGGCFRSGAPTIYCVGSDDHHELGIDPMDGTSPRNVRDAYASIDVVSGRAHRCILGTDHHVSCWGDGHLGQLGVTPTSLPDTSPTGDPCDGALHVVGDATPLSLSAVASSGDGDTTCAITRNQAIVSEVVCWGDNAAAQTGHAPSTFELPVDGAGALRPIVLDASTPLSRARQVIVGPRAACAIDDQEAMYCWGDVDYDASTAPSPLASLFVVEAP